MKNVLKTLVILLLLFCFLFLIPSAAHVGFAEIIEIPIDAETQLKKNPEAIPLPLESGFLSEKEYQDPSISVKIGVGRMFDTDYMTARVKIANATQIRSMMAGTYANSMEVFCDRLVKRTNAVLAINGDYFTKRRNVGVMVRQGKVWYMPKTDRNLAYNKEIQFDILLIDTAGDLHILKSATMEALEPYVGNIVNSFTFGPGLVIDGVKQGNFQNTNNSPQKKTQRMAICQTGPLEYLCGEGETAVYDVEAEKDDHEKAVKAIPKRMRFYRAKLDGRGLKVGEEYGKLRKLIMIMITPFDPFGLNRMRYTVRNACLEVPEMPYDDGATMIFLNTKGNPDDESEELC